MKFDFKKVKASPWSHTSTHEIEFPYFLPLPILGKRTGDIEALSSYLCREAELLSEWAHPFTSRLLHSTLHPEELPKEKRIPSKGLHPCNGIGKMQERFTKAIHIASNGKVKATKMTLKPLEFLTDQLNHGLCRDTMCWCPSCWKADIDKEQSPYLRLYWTLQQTQVCAIHGEKLIDLCPMCGASKQLFPKFPRQHVCDKCGHHLYKITSKQQKQRESFTREQEWFSHAIYNLIERVVSSRLTVTQETVSRAIRRIISVAGIDTKEFANLLHADHRLVTGLIKKTRRVYFPAFMDMCYRIDIPPDQFLFDKDNIVNTSSWRQHPHVGYVSMAKLSSRQKQRIYEDLQKMLQNRKGPPGHVSHLASKYNVRDSTIRYNFPTLYKEVVSRRSAWDRKFRKEAHQAKLERLTEGIFSLAKQGIYPSERKLRDLKYVESFELCRADFKYILEAYQTFYKGHGFLDT